MKINLLLAFVFISFLTAQSQTPQLLKDINLNSSGMDYYEPTLLEYHGKAYFSANDGIYGTELWVTDGTSGGTHRVTDLWPGSGSSFPRSRIIYNDLIYFSAYDTIHGQELWATDGASGGTFLVKDIYPGSNNDLPYSSGANNFYIYNGKLIFSANDAAHGNELWISDGTDSGTVLLKDINPGVNFGYPSSFIEFQNILFFTAKDAVHGAELWKTDGTANGTVMVKDIFPGLNDGYSNTQWCIYKNKLYFNPNDGVHGFELWETDGTDAGTQMVIDIYPGAGSGYPTFFSVYHDEMYFPAFDMNGRELWKSDGTAAGTVMVSDIFPGPTGSFPAQLTYYKDKLYFRCNNGISGTELWTTDGTTAGTQIACDIKPGSLSSMAQRFTVYGANLYFIAINQTADGYQLFRYNDSTGISTQVVPPVFLPNACADNDLDAVSTLTVSLGKLFYPATYDALETEFYYVEESLIGIDEPPENIVFSMFPVPVISTLSIRLIENKTATALVFNALGEIVITKQFKDEVSLDLSTFAPGIFSVKVLTTEGKNMVKTFVKQ